MQEKGIMYLITFAELSAILLEKESELAKIRQELKMLEPFKVQIDAGAVMKVITNNTMRYALVIE